MKKLIFISVILIFTSELSYCQSSDVVKIQTKSFTTGGTSIKIPPPANEFTYLGYENREIVELFIPESNRLICAFVLSSELSGLTDDDATMSKYSLVEVPRGGEYTNFKPSDFKEVVDASKEVFDEINSIIAESEEEFNNRMKSLDVSNLKLKLGEPIMLGTFFSRQDAYGLGMIMSVEMDGDFWKMGALIILMRVKERLLFVYLYAEYENEDTLKWLREVGEKWSDEILKVN